MSGGAFDYKQYSLEYIADEIDTLIRNNEKVDQWGDKNNFSEKTLLRFQEGIEQIKKAAIYAQRIDWLVSGDDGEKTFHERLAEELKQED